MDIVEWLRKEAELVALDRLGEAADEIERLMAERDALRAALTEAQTVRWREVQCDTCGRTMMLVNEQSKSSEQIVRPMSDFIRPERL